jgi:hypothetical protein
MNNQVNPIMREFLNSAFSHMIKPDQTCNVCGLVSGKDCPCGTMNMCNNAEGCDDCAHGLEKEEEQ